MLQVADVILGNIDAPAWVFQVVLLLLVLGFPLAVFFAWAFELTPEGIKKEKHVDRNQSITQTTSRKLDFVIIALLSMAVVYLVTARFSNSPEVSYTGLTATLDVVAPDPGEIGPPHTSIAVLPFVKKPQLHAPDHS